MEGEEFLNRYVCGFMFDFCSKNVLLIEKKRPCWQADLLNGIGGKIEPHEPSLCAMIREFEEETGIKTEYDTWDFLFSYKNSRTSWVVDFYAAVSQRVEQAKTMTDEKLILIPVRDLSHWKTIPNLQWIIPLALQRCIVPTSLFER